MGNYSYGLLIRGLVEPATLAVVAAVMAAVATLGQYPWVAHYVNRRGPERTRVLFRDMLADAGEDRPTRPLEERLAARAPRGMSGGHDPSDLAEKRWEKEVEADAVESEILATIMERWGPAVAEFAQNTIPARIWKKAGRAGAKWPQVFKPWFSRFDRAADAMRAEPGGPAVRLSEETY